MFLIWELLLFSLGGCRGEGRGELIGGSWCETVAFFLASFRFFRGVWSAVGEEIFRFWV